MNVIKLTSNYNKRNLSVFVVVEHIQYVIHDGSGSVLSLSSHNNGGLMVAEAPEVVVAMMKRAVKQDALLLAEQIVEDWGTFVDHDDSMNGADCVETIINYVKMAREALKEAK